VLRKWQSVNDFHPENFQIKVDIIITLKDKTWRHVIRSIKLLHSLINWLTAVSASVHEESHFISAQGLYPFTVSVNFYSPYLHSIYIAGSPHIKINSSHSYRFVCGKQENLSIYLRSEKKFISFMKSILDICAAPPRWSSILNSLGRLHQQICWFSAYMKTTSSILWQNTVLPYYELLIFYLYKRILVICGKNYKRMGYMQLNTPPTQNSHHVIIICAESTFN